MKRGRNQRRRPGGGVNPNRALDSNGPEVRIRGTANQIYDKYIALARDASSAGDRVKAENYLQHAEHYFRLIRAAQGNQPVPQQNHDGDGEQPTIENGRDRRPEPRARDDRDDDNGDDEDDAAPVKKEAEEAAAAPAEETEEKPKRPRRRRTTKRAAKDEDAADSDEETAAAAQ